MQIFEAILFCLVAFATVTYGHHHTPCDDLSGTWRNQLGSNMTIQKIGDTGKITGQYNTSVESSTGAATISSKISGLVKSVDDGSLVAFNVLWNNGASITSWVGQCIVCDGQPKIYTTWVLRSLQTPPKRWMSTRINQDTFWKVEDLEQPPQQVNDGRITENPELVGKWSSVSGDSFEINSAVEHGGFEGVHSPSGSAHVGSVFGRYAGNETHTAVGFAAAHQAHIRGWTGHIYNPQQPNKVLETSWLSQAFSNNCNNPRKFVQYGMDKYRKSASQSA